MSSPVCSYLRTGIDNKLFVVVYTTFYLAETVDSETGEERIEGKKKIGKDAFFD